MYWRWFINVLNLTLLIIFLLFQYQSLVPRELNQRNEELFSSFPHCLIPLVCH